MADKTLRKRKPSRPSTITMLDPQIKDAVDTAIREGRLTIDQIVKLIAEEGGDASRSAVGRYVKNSKERMEDYIKANQMAAVWVEKIGKEPEGQMGRMVLELLRLISWKTMGGIEEASPEDLMFLAKAMKDMASADKLAVDRELVVRKLIAARAEKVAGEIAKEAKKANVSPETIKSWQDTIRGVAKK
ncbi:MAG: DUF3486 family protein [Burkholderiales bacterium]|nr:DUF3486 family protein [Burkholderiales bacterium]